MSNTGENTNSLKKSDTYSLKHRSPFATFAISVSSILFPKRHALKVNQDWFVFLEDLAHGPMTANDIRRLAAHNKIDSETPVRRSENSKWIKAGSVKGLTFGSPIKNKKLSGNDHARQSEQRRRRARKQRHAPPPREVAHRNFCLKIGLFAMVLAEVGIRLAGAGSIHESVQTGSAVLCVSMGILTVILWKRFAGDGKNAPASSRAEAVTDVAMLTARNAAALLLAECDNF